MASEFDILDFRCWNQLRNGEDFSQNTGEYTPNLVGNIGEKVKIQIDIRLSVSAFTEGAEEWYIDLTQNEITRASGSFLQDGLRVGDRYLFYPNWQNRKNIADEYQADIDFISNDGRVLKYSVVTGSATSSGNVTNMGMVLEQIDPINKSAALFVKFGLLGNDESFNYLSKTTENQQVYYIGGLTSAPANAESLGTIKDWVTGSIQAFHGATSSGFKGLTYTILHEFILNPFFILAYRQFIDNQTIPDLLAGDNSLKYAVELEFRKTLTDTNSSKIHSFDKLQGFTGWYGENFNGLNPDHEILSVLYRDNATNDVLGGINISLTTKVRVAISKKSGPITDFSCGFYLFRLPKSEDEYIGTESDLVENFIYESKTLTHPDTIDSPLSASITAGVLYLDYLVTYSTAERLRLTTDDEFLVAVQVEDPNISAGDSDRIMLLADVGNYVDEDYLSEFVEVETYGFLGHGQALGGDASSSRVISNEDGLILEALFGVNTTRNVVINSISISLQAYNNSNDDSFELDRYDFNIGDLVVSGGVQQINVDTVRGYPLPLGDEFNLVQITTEGVNGDYQQYGLVIGQKTKWQEWLLNPEVADVFFNSAEPNNNLNDKTSNYSGEEGYNIYMALIVNVTGEDDLGRTITGDYIHRGGVLTVEDYDESDDGVTGVIETFDLESGNPLAGNILYNGKDTLFRAVFQNASTMQYGIHRIEPSQSQGDGILELSNVMPSVHGNLLKPLENEAALKFEKAGSVLTTECIIDGDLVQEGVNYKLSARCGIIVPPIVFTFQTTHPNSGDFTPRILDNINGLLLDSDVTWVFENGHSQQGTEPVFDINDLGFDGTLQTVEVYLTNIQYANFIEIGQESLAGALDLTMFEALEYAQFNNQNLTSVDLTGVELLSDVTLLFQANDIASFLVDTNYAIRVQEINLSGNDFTVWARGGLIYDASLITFSGTPINDFETDPSDTFERLLLSGCGIAGVQFDITDIDMVGSVGDLRIDSNPNINLNNLPTSFSGDLRVFNIQNCSKTNTLNLSGYTWGSFQDIQAFGLGITSLIPPVGAHECIRYYIFGCSNLTDTVMDLSDIRNDNGLCSVQVQQNPSITSILESSVPTTYGVFLANNCNITGILDFSNNDFGGTAFLSLGVYDNPLLTDFRIGTQVSIYGNIIMRGCSITNFNNSIGNFLSQPLDAANNAPQLLLQDNGMNTAQVDAVLALMDSVFSASAIDPTTINLSGTNAAPTGGAANANVVSLVSKNYIVVLTP